MALSFTNALNQTVNFGLLAQNNLLQYKTVALWVLFPTMPSDSSYYNMVSTVDEGADDNFEWFSTTFVKYDATRISPVFFEGRWNTNAGSWRTTSSFITPGDGIIHSIVYTYDYSSTSNDPTIYIDGTSVAVTELTTPAGTNRTGGGAITRIGSWAGSVSAYFKLYSAPVYNRIASASEIADWHASRKFIPSRNGLVFAPRLNGAAGGVKDGDTLGSTNYITDLVSGARGTPSGSPIILADNYLRGE